MSAREHEPQPADLSWVAKLSGRFLVFEGADGSGKSTQLRRFAACVRGAGVPLCEVREPGGTPIGERIREILLDPIHDEMAVRCEMMLYMASRAQLVEQKIRPALSRGEMVLADRFISSTLAYQGAAGGLPREEILAVADAACGPRGRPGSCWPDLVVIFDVDEATARSRLSATLDRMEQKAADFHRRVRDGYRDQVATDPAHHLLIDASGSEDHVEQLLRAKLRERFGR